MLRSSFSVEYDHPEHPDNFCAVDWNHWERGRWVRSWKSVTGSEWYREDEDGGVLGKLGHSAILKKFGLENFGEHLTVERIQFMSPASLIKYRELKD